MKNNILRGLLACAMLACLCGCLPPAQAQDSDGWKGQNDRDIVNIDHNSLLPAGETAEDVVAVMGNSEVDGDVSDSAVAVMGNVTVNGTVGSGGAVAVLGNAYINGKVDGDVVAVLGNVILGPQAVISGEVTEVMGTVQRSPTAVISGGTVGVLSGIFGDVEGLHAWVRECLLFGRPLAPSVAVAWAWWLALAALAFYILIAALFPGGLRRCEQTLETHPGPSVLATIIVTLLMPVVIVALCITVIGIAVIPILWFALFCAGIFGRVVAIAWLGGRCLRLASPHSASKAALEVLVGGVLVLALYMVPVLGFLVSMLLGAFGFGAVMYTLLLAARPAHAKPVSDGPGSGAGGPSTPGAPGSGPTTGEQQPAGTAGAGVPPPSWTASTTTGNAFSESAAGTAPPPPPPPPAAHSVHALDLATLPRAGFWIRMLALLIDLILVGVALSWLHHGDSGMLLLLATYGAIMWKLKGTTVGGIVFDLKVVRNSGGPLDWGTAIVRALGCFLSLVVCGLGFIWIAVDHDHQAWHDKIAGTVVVRVPKGVGLI
ncbi:MAG TPA: RDD family protein [Steroidobacteraceae bacterium]|jgi:uncharacterized RDD family membrane protein YckC